MKLLFDQNLSHWLVQEMSVEFPGSMHVRDVGFASASDADVWTYAKIHGFVLVSKDTDFQQRALLFGHPPKVIWLRYTSIQSFNTDALASVLALS